MNEFVFTSMRRVFVCFLEEIEDSKKAFRNYLTFRTHQKASRTTLSRTHNCMQQKEVVSMSARKESAANHALLIESSTVNRSRQISRLLFKLVLISRDIKLS